MGIEIGGDHKPTVGTEREMVAYYLTDPRTVG